MKFHKQRFLHRPEEGQMGDCFRIVLACLLDVDPEDVPHFMQAPEDVPVAEIWRRVDEWLAEHHGLRYLCFPFDPGDLQTWLHGMDEGWPGLRWELSGKSPRGTTHSVIVEGSKIIHDPHPEGGGIVGPDEKSGHYFMGFMLPIAVHGVRPAAEAEAAE